MRLRKAWWLVIVLGTGVDAWAQPATSVQLPTFSFFSTSTTVSVPDRGSAYLGGVKRASSGRTESGMPLAPFRPFRNNSIGGDRSASHQHVSVWIHDFEEMEEVLLGQPAGGTAARPQASRSALASMGQSLQPRDPNAGAIWQSPLAAPDAEATARSVEEERARRSQKQQTRLAEADDFFQRAQAAEAAGKPTVAKIYYQMAARRATGELKEQVLARLEAIGVAQTAGRIAQNEP